MDVVEILEKKEQAYFKAKILDLDGQNVLINYVGETDSIFVEMSRVRCLPPQLTAEFTAKFNPGVGDRVEVEFIDEEGPDSWWDGKIVNVKGDLFAVKFPDGNQEIVEKSRIRPSYGHTPVRLMKKIFPVPHDKQQNFLAIDHKHHLGTIAKHANLLVLKITDDGKNVVCLATSLAAAETASTLVEMLFLKISRLVEKETEKRQLQAQVFGVNADYPAITSFQVSPELIGLVIGTKGCNIKAAEAMPGVSKIEARDDGLFTIAGESQAAVEAAREELEPVQESMALPPDRVGMLIGSKGQQIMELQQLSGCRLVVQDGRNGPELLLLGTRGRVGKGRALAGYALETLEEERSRQALIGSLSAQLRSLNRRPVVPRGRGGRGVALPVRPEARYQVVWYVIWYTLCTCTI